MKSELVPHVLTIQIGEVAGGGFMVCESDPESGEVVSMIVKSTITEARDVASKRITDWNIETDRERRAQIAAESPNVVAPRRWWRSVE